MRQAHTKIIGSGAALGLVCSVAALALGGIPSVVNAGASTTSGNEHFWVSAFNVNNQNPTTIVTTGLFTDAGTLSGPSANKATLSQGGFSINSTGLNPSFKLNPQTCFFTASYKGSISLGHGTGVYAGISGTLSVSGREQGVTMKAQTGKCEEGNTPALGVTGLIRASGNVTLGS
jgi:hypothetical protein